LVVGSFTPDLVIILDIPESVALQRALAREGGEDRFEKKGAEYQAKVRQAFKQVAAGDERRYQVIDANQSIDAVTRQVFNTVNRRFELSLEVDQDVE
jgi:dTMP kinase